MPWPEWGDTAVTLLQVGDALRASRCPCGCGQWADLAHDPETSGWWDVEPVQCYARAALVEWRDQNKDAGPETLIGVRLNAEWSAENGVPEPDEDDE